MMHCSTFLLPVIAVSASIFIYLILQSCHQNIVIIDDLDFQYFDGNGDGRIDKEEFLDILPYINKKCSQTRKFPLLCDNSNHMVILRSEFIPLDLDSVGEKSGESHLFKGDLKHIDGLLNWTKPNKRLHYLESSVFLQFLPLQSQPSVGDTWVLYNPQHDTPSHLRHDPPEVLGIEALIKDCLSGLHSRPFLQTRFGPRGGFAFLRAKAGGKLDIYFRFHAEFQLNDPPVLPFWFTPAQFRGNIILDTESKTILHFHMYVPTERALNVDMEWFASDEKSENLQVEIGFMPRMEIMSLPLETGKQDADIEWNEEVAVWEAFEALEKGFYPFKQVKYYTFQDAFDISVSQNKLVHNIVLWGSLDDQSC